MKNLITKYFKSPKGLYAMCIISLTESIFFIIPPDPFLALICIGKKFKKIFYPFFLCTIFSVIGGCIAYYLGDQIVDISKETNFKFITNNLENIEELKLKINNQTFSMMLTSAFTPLPFKIFCISAGIMNVNFVDFLLGSIVGRGSRFFIFSYLGYKYGSKFEIITKSRKFNIIMISLIGFLIIYLYYKWN